ncbi:MAG TPA: YdjY domain-containing protein [Thermoanaerobaculia bacterium]|jgi:hypothetical protein|nr:YdjY domain-containing protein [Thermoanaerobaculia bacterium]
MGRRNAFLLIVFSAAIALALHSRSGESTPAIRVSGRQIELPAVVAQDSFERELLGMPGYHLIVWKDGRAATAALLRAEVTDAEVLDALERLGARPGNALGMAVWEKRKDPASRAPDQVIQGPPVEILVKVPGRKAPLTLDQILADPGGRGFDMRFGGHRASIPKWKSGCVVCLYSCPGSKIGNARYTVRDYVKGTTRFRVRPGALPADGTRVTVVMRLR